ncbi:MAG: acyl-CoA thioester hydrolase [Chlamydiales bacterium]|jgi:acyl-CoA thioester hydrolase
MAETQASEFKRTRLMEFAETDMAGIVHFANFFRFMEETEHAFFRSLGLTVHGHEGESVFGWVRVRATCDYTYPARYQDQVEIHLRVLEMGSKSMRYQCTFQAVDDAGTPSGPQIARGELTIVHVRKEPSAERLRAAPMPAEVTRLIAAAGD